MDTTQNFSPELLIFFFFYIVLCIWAIRDIFRSNFKRINKAIWIAVVLFAPLGGFIYVFIGRRLKPFSSAPTAEKVSDNGVPPQEASAVPQREHATGWPAPLVLFAVAVLCFLLYFKGVALLGQEKTAFLLLGAMIVVATILTFFYVNQARKK